MDRKVILLADVKGVGHKNDVVNVSVGYAANYLLPQGLAVDATPQRLAGLAKRKVAQSQEKDAALTRAREIAAKLQGQTVTVQRQGNATGAALWGDHPRGNRGGSCKPGWCSGREESREHR